MTTNELRHLADVLERAFIYNPEDRLDWSAKLRAFATRLDNPANAADPGTRTPEPEITWDEVNRQNQERIKKYMYGPEPAPNAQKTGDDGKACGPRTPEHMDEQQLRDYFDANVRHLPNATSHPFRIHAPGISLQSTSKERLWRFFREKVAGTRNRMPDPRPRFTYVDICAAVDCDKDAVPGPLDYYGSLCPEHAAQNPRPAVKPVLERMTRKVEIKPNA